MLGPFTFTFTLKSEEFEKFEKVGCFGYVIDHDELLTELINPLVSDYRIWDPQVLYCKAMHIIHAH